MTGPTIPIEVGGLGTPGLSRHRTVPQQATTRPPTHELNLSPERASNSEKAELGRMKSPSDSGMLAQRAAGCIVITDKHRASEGGGGAEMRGWVDISPVALSYND